MLLLVACLVVPATSLAQDFSVLVFSKTAGFRHSSIADGIALVQSLGSANGFAVDTTEDAGQFTDANLAGYAVVVWLSTTGDVLDDSQQGAFERFIQAGGGWVGVHSATDTEYGWPWYGGLIGGDAWFRSHPSIQTGTLAREDAGHVSSAHYPATFSFTDEWYNFRENPRPAVSVLVTIDESSYDPGSNAMGSDHPISWYHEYDGGRAWYTAMGHRSETFADAGFAQHLLGGIQWAAGGGQAGCDDGNPCTDDSELPGGGCDHAPNSDPCDDGLACTTDDVCSGGGCVGLAPAECDDGDPCTQDSCDDSSGECSNAAEPASACIDAGKSLVQILDRPARAKHRLTWKWLRAGEIPLAALGDPAGSTEYALCIYDSTSGQHARAAALAVPSGAAWAEKRSGNFKYKDKAGASDGVRLVFLRAGGVHDARVTLKAREPNLSLPGSVGPDRYLEQEPVVTVQLTNSEQGCWGAEFAAAKKNLADRFKAKLP